MNVPCPHASLPSPSKSRAPRRLMQVVATSAVVFIAGCATEPQAYQPLDTTKYTLENTDKFEVLDRGAQTSVSCTGLQDRTLADGRLEVIANLRNRENKRVEVQASCAFKDDQGVTILEETGWQTVTLAENATEAVRFTASGAAAKKYTIRVRQSH